MLDQPIDKAALDGFSKNLRSQFSAAIKISLPEARQVLTDANNIIKQLKPADDAAQESLTELRETAAFLQRVLAAQETDIQTLAEKILHDPDDFENLLIYGIKFQMLENRLYERESLEQGMERLDRVTETLRQAIAKTTNDRVKNECNDYLLRIDEYLRPKLNQAQERLSLVGTAAVLPSADHGSWLDGHPFDAADLERRVILLDFWALWCGPCIAGLPQVNAWHEKYAPEGLIIVAVAHLDEDSERSTQLEKMRDLFREQTLGFRCFLDDGMLLDAHRVRGLPHYALIDRSGKIRFVRTGNGAHEDLESEIQKLLTE